MILIGQKIGNYEIDEALSAGSYGYTFIAHDINNPVSRVVIKVLKSGLKLDDKARFNVERQTLIDIEHINLVKGFEGEVDNEEFGSYIVMEYVEGCNLEEYICSDIKDFINLFIQIFRGLIYLHSRGIIHRDLKPANIFLTINKKDKTNLGNGQNILVKIGDFGLIHIPYTSGDARRTRVGDFLGSPYYASPEQLIDSSNIDLRADLYPIGVMMYEILTSTELFTEIDWDKPESIIGNRKKLIKIIPPTERCPIMGIPILLENFIIKLLSPNPVDRYQSAGEALRDLEIVAQSLDQIVYEDEIPDYSEEYLFDQELFEKGKSPTVIDSSEIVDQKENYWRNQLESNKELQILEGFEEKEDWDEVIRVGNIILNRDPGHRKVRVKTAAAYRKRGKIYLKEEDYNQAAVDFGNSILLEPRNPENYLLRADAYEEDNSNQENIDRAISDYNQAIKIEPLNTNNILRRANAYIKRGRASLAGEDLNKVLELDPDNIEALEARAENNSELQQYSLSIDDLTEVVKIKNNDANIFFQRGVAYFETQKYEEAIKDFTEAINLESENAYFYEMRGKSYAILENYDEAISDLTQNINLLPNIANNYHLRGLAYHYKGDLALARNDYETSDRMGHMFSKTMIAKLNAGQIPYQVKQPSEKDSETNMSQPVAYRIANTPIEQEKLEKNIEIIAVLLRSNHEKTIYPKEELQAEAQIEDNEFEQALEEMRSKDLIIIDKSNKSENLGSEWYLIEKTQNTIDFAENFYQNFEKPNINFISFASNQTKIGGRMILRHPSYSELDFIFLNSDKVRKEGFVNLDVRNKFVDVASIIRLYNKIKAVRSKSNDFEAFFINIFCSEETTITKINQILGNLRFESAPVYLGVHLVRNNDSFATFFTKPGILS